MSELHVFYNDCDVVIAASPEDAGAVLAEIGCTLDNPEDYPFVQWPDDKVFTVRDEHGEVEGRKTCAEWAAGNGRGYLACTEC